MSSAPRQGLPGETAPVGTSSPAASQSGHRLSALSADHGIALASSPVEDVAVPEPGEFVDTLHAYQCSRRGNSLRVGYEADTRSPHQIHPGIIMTLLPRDELT